MKQRTVPQIGRILQYSKRRMSRGNTSAYVNFWFNIAWNCIEIRTKTVKYELLTALEQKGKKMLEIKDSKTFNREVKHVISKAKKLR